MKRAIQSCVFSALSSSTGLLAVLLIGIFWWQVARGLPGILLGAGVSAGIALILRRRMDITTSVIAATIGGAIACFLAIASAEVLTPGSVDWALKGGGYGAAIGVPAAFVLGPLGLLEDRHSLQRN